MDPLRSIWISLRNLVARGVVSRVDDSPGLQSLQVGLLEGETRSDLERLQGYGFTAHPHPDAECLVVFPGGTRAHGIVIAVDDRRYRLTSLDPGEVALYTDEGDRIVLRRGQRVEIVSGGSVEVTAPEVIVTASTRVQIDTPLLEVTGDVTVGGSVDAAVDVKAGPLDVSLVGHTHGMAGHTHVAPSGGGPTGPPTPASTAAP